jgi:predicted AAA+ superfamily ATPase
MFDGRHELHYWQTRSRVEVDFIVYGESGLYAVEVKSSRQVQPEGLARWRISVKTIHKVAAICSTVEKNGSSGMA